MGKGFLSLRFVLTGILALGLLLIGGLNIQEKRIYVTWEDGCTWVQTANGVEARIVAKDGPCEHAGVREGDFLTAINDRVIKNEADVPNTLFNLGPYPTIKYALVRNGVPIGSTTPVYIGPPSDRLVRQRLYLEIIGLYYFVAGLFVLIKSPRSPRVLHFYLVCLFSFVLFAYSYTGKLDAFDWTVFWLDTAASVFLPPLFLHFCLEFPLRSELLRKHAWLIWLFYLPGAALMGTWAAFVTGGIDSVQSPLLLRELLEAITDLHFGVYFVASAGVLFWTYRKAQTPALRQQMKWVTRGVAIGVMPFFLLQSLPRAAGFVPDMWVDAAIFPLVLIPTSFGYAINRYKLMDVDVIFKRGVTYTLATASVVTLIVLTGEILGSNLAPLSILARLGMTIVAALLFSPIKDQFQVWLDKMFYRERYSVRHTLIDFGRTLGTEVQSENMLERIVDRLTRAFFVDRAAIFVEAVGNGAFVPALVHGVEIDSNPDLPFLVGQTERPYLFFHEAVLSFNYFIPCRVKNRVIAYIALGQTRKGDYLNSEDLDLLEAMSDYVGIALENSRLYKSLEQRASEYEDLKDFSENIIESINVGVVVEDVNGRIAGWNKALETMTGVSRDLTLGKPTVEVIRLDFLHRLAEHPYLYKQQWDGLTVNFSVTSLLDKSGTTRGRLIIIDNITDRVRLEDQLVQSEKLTSIGLLAAGVAHEVNTPLAVISSYSQMLRKQISPADNGYKLLEKITAQTFRASEIVNSLLSFSRTNATEFALVDIHKVINETLSLLEHPLKTAQVKVHADLAAKVPTVTGNAGKLQQVFLNLFLNARDAMPEGGVLDIRTSTHEGRVEIVVADTGVGISRDHIKKIYDPFFTTKTAGKGTGLGLSVSYGIVMEHGGSISVESNLGEGTSFRLDFPLSRRIVNV
jgi:two-component system NtrC family sensor kinase